jgi:hypothetical protein
MFSSISFSALRNCVFVVLCSYRTQPRPIGSAAAQKSATNARYSARSAPPFIVVYPNNPLHPQRSGSWTSGSPLGVSQARGRDLPVRRRTELGKDHDLALVQMEVDMYQFDADTRRNSVLVHQIFQVVEFVSVSLGHILQIMDKGDLAVHRHQMEGVLDQAHDFKVTGSRLEDMQGERHKEFE